MTCIICVLGIPASGKTQFCTQLSSSLKRDFSDSSVVIASYDALIPAEEEHLLIAASVADSFSASKWRDRRKTICKAVGCLLSDFLHKNISASGNGDEDVVEETKKKILTLNNVEIRLKKNLIVIVDDNLYYRSMRYEYYRMARTYECGFCEIHLKCDINVALARNTRRSNSVPEEIIKTMGTKLEEPLPDKNKWEKYSLSVLSGESTDSNLSGAIDLIKNAVEDPVGQIDECDEEMKANCRIQCSTNVIHQVDNALRKITSELIQQLRKNSTFNQFHSINDARLSVLKDLKNGDLTLDPDSVSLIESGQVSSDSENNNIKEYLLLKLKEKL